jgi:hypothetical protein
MVVTANMFNVFIGCSAVRFWPRSGCLANPRVVTTANLFSDIYGLLRREVLAAFWLPS